MNQQTQTSGFPVLKESFFVFFNCTSTVLPLSQNLYTHLVSNCKWRNGEMEEQKKDKRGKLEDK